MPRTALKTYHIEINRRGSHFWSIIKSSNHKIVWTSETYTSKQNAQIPALKLINNIGKRRCSLTFIDHNKRSENVKLKCTRPVKSP